MKNLRRRPPTVYADGFGKDTIYNSGNVVHVTNLNNTGAGSFRSAVDRTSPTVIVFDVSGIIEVTQALIFDNPQVTVLGITSPGGITVKGAASLTDQPAVRLEAKDLWLSHFAIRPGAHATDSGNELACISFPNTSANNIMLDHMSLSWAVSNCITVGVGPQDVTIQWCMIYEGLKCSTHSKTLVPGTGPCLPQLGETHNRLFNMGNGPTTTVDKTGNFSVHHCFFANGDTRMPSMVNVGPVDIINNIFFNFGIGAVDQGAQPGNTEPSRANVIKNYFLAGNQTTAASLPIRTNAFQVNGEIELYEEGNIFDGIMDTDLPSVYTTESMLLSSRIAAPAVYETDARRAFSEVLNYVGARPNRRDFIDQRVIQEARDRAGSWPDDPSDVGGWTQ